MWPPAQDNHKGSEGLEALECSPEETDQRWSSESEQTYRNSLKLSKHERHWIKVKEWSLPVLQKNVYVLIYLTVFINFCTKIFYKFHEVFPYRRPS